MISALGNAALTATCLLAVTAAAAGFAAARPSVTGAAAGSSSARLARWCVIAAWLGAVACVALMEGALLTGDFSVAYVAQTGSRSLPTFYAVTSLWAAAGGSLLLWLAVLATFAAVHARRPRGANPAAHAASVAVLGALVAAFAALTLVGEAPFQPTATPPADGPGPNPLLQDHPAMGVHPPLLYAGFAGLAVPFALSVGALVAGRVDRAWSQAVRRWLLVSWTFLTAGVALGAWWSYAVLGWGGYWAWDPVENVSLMPWLLATAALHVLRMPRRTPGWAAGAVSLIGAAFLLVVLGTLLTRSGAVLSVHSFSESPLGPPLLGLFLVALVAWTTLVVTRRDRLGEQTSGSAALLSRQTALRAQAVLLSLITTTIFAGTILPVLVEAANGERLSVGSPWFNRTTGPPALAVLALMAVGPLIAWDRDTADRLSRRLRWPGLAALLTVGAVGLAAPYGPLFPIAAAVAAFVVVSFVQQLTWPIRRRAAGALVAHAGIALAAVAVVATGHGSSTQDSVTRGESVTTGAVSASLLGVERGGDDRRSVAAARVLIGEGDRVVGVVTPELRLYEAHSTVVASPANVSSVADDIQVALLDVDPETGSATIRVTVTPLLWWLWVAAAITVLGGLIAGWPLRRRQRSTAPAPRQVREEAPV